MPETIEKVSNKPYVYLICPVRNADPEVLAKLKLYVADLEAQGKTVHWPPRDTDQSDPTGVKILEQNRQATLDAKEIHIWWDPESKGSHIDLGMLAMALLFDSTKKIILLNRNSLYPPKTKVENLILELAKRYW